MPLQKATAAVPLLAASPSAGTPPDSEPPAVLSYFAMRRAAGYIGLALPPVVVFFDRFWHHTNGMRACVPSSISASYYTGARNFFVGSLCSVGVFLITSIGYKEDRPFSIFAGAMAFLVAFSPTIPDSSCDIPGSAAPFALSHPIHIAAAVLLFLTLAWFCLVLFCRSSPDTAGLTLPQSALPRQKRKRNLVYIVCGCTMVAAMVYYFVAVLLSKFGHPEPRYALLVVEWICLWAFALAWLVKGQQILQDDATPNE